MVSCVPWASQVSTIRSASAYEGAIGFSQWIALTPASAVAMTIGAWWCGQVQMLTMSSCSRASISW